MKTSKQGALPTADQLQRLTLRAIAAYAVRSARRGSAMLRGTIQDAVIETPLHLAEQLIASRVVDQSAGYASAAAVAVVAKSMLNLDSRELKQAALCLTRVAMTTVFISHAIYNLAGSKAARREIAMAADEAARCARNSVDALGDAAAIVTAEAARADYEILRKHFGKHQDVVLGEPIDLSEEWWQRQDVKQERS